MKTQSSQKSSFQKTLNPISPVHVYFAFGGGREQRAVSSRQVPRSRPSGPGGTGKHARARRCQMPNAVLSTGSTVVRPSSGRGASCPQPRLPPAAGVICISAGPGRGDPKKPHLCVSDLLACLRNAPVAALPMNSLHSHLLLIFLGATGLFLLL